MSNQQYTQTARTTTFTGDDNRKVPGAIGVKAVLDITSVPTVDTLTMKIQGKDVISGKYYDIPGAATTAQAGTGTFILTVMPGVTVAANVSVADALPDVYRVVVTASGSGAFNYTVGLTELVS